MDDFDAAGGGGEFPAGLDDLSSGEGVGEAGVLGVPTSPRRDEVRALALAAYHRSLRNPDLRSEDPVARARALVAVDDAREAYRAAGGSPGSQWSLAYQQVYLDARELLGEDVSERRAAVAEELSAARSVDRGGSKSG